MLALGLFLAAGSKTFRFLVNRRWPEAIAELTKEINADGINGDTQDGVPVAFLEAADKTGHPLAFEPEGSPSGPPIRRVRREPPRSKDCIRNLENSSLESCFPCTSRAMTLFS